MSLILDILFPRHCYRCGKRGRYLCHQCRAKIEINPVFPNEHHTGRLSLFRYDKAIRNMIRDYKYNFITDLADELTELSIYHLKKYYKNLLLFWQKNNFTFIPIPQHYSKTNFRGFVPNNLLIQKLAPRLKLNFQLDTLSKINNTLAQAQFTQKKDRLSNTNHSLNINAQAPTNIILFDDVFTTGSTIRSALDILPKKSKIWIFTLSG
jgi:predicted amidophosphoribosyltransferase